MDAVKVIVPSSESANYPLFVLVIFVVLLVIVISGPRLLEIYRRTPPANCDAHGAAIAEQEDRLNRAIESIDDVKRTVDDLRSEVEERITKLRQELREDNMAHQRIILEHISNLVQVIKNTNGGNS